MIEPSRLLAGRRDLSRPEKDAILDAVLDEVEPRRSSWRWPALGVVMTAAAALLIALWPHPGRIDEITARGGDLPAGFALSCVPAPCAAGTKLVFDITSTGGATYFSAFARNDQTWIWYFPHGPAGHSVPVPAGGGVLDFGISLGPEHAPGSYTVVGVFSDRPLDRAAVRAWVERGEHVVSRPLVMQ